MSDKTKKRDKKSVITKRDLYGNSWFAIIQYTILFILFLCGFIVVVGPFFEIPVWCKLTVGIVVSFLLLGMLFELLAAANNISKIKSSEIVITDAVSVHKRKELSMSSENTWYTYYATLELADKSIEKDVEIDSLVYDRLKNHSSCYYFMNLNLPNRVYPKDYYILGDDLLPFYEGKDI